MVDYSLATLAPGVRLRELARYRTCTIPAKQLITSFSPARLIAQLKAAGFEFVTETCPVQIAGDWDFNRNKDGSVTYRQRITPA